MGIKRFAVGMGLLLLTASGCATTAFETTWRASDARPVRLEGQKVVALFVSRDPLVRRRAENAMAKEISARGAQGVPAYTVLSDDEIRDRDKAKAKVEGLGYSGAVVMRVVGSETYYTYEPGFWWGRPYYRHFWGGYWGWGWGMVSAPGYLSVDRVVSIETLVYSFERDELIWAGVSKTYDLKRVESVIAELAAGVSAEMAKEGLLVQGRPSA